MKTQHSKNSCHRANTVLRGKLDIKCLPQKILQIKRLSFHFKKLEKSKLKPKHVAKNNKGRKQ